MYNNFNGIIVQYNDNSTELDTCMKFYFKYHISERMTLNNVNLFYGTVTSMSIIYIKTVSVSVPVSNIYYLRNYYNETLMQSVNNFQKFNSIKFKV